MYQGFARTGQYWWLGSPIYFDYGNAYGRYVTTSGGRYYSDVYSAYGLRPVIVLTSGVEIEGNGTYDEPYVIDTTSS